MVSLVSKVRKLIPNNIGLTLFFGFYVVACDGADPIDTADEDIDSGDVEDTGEPPDPATVELAGACALEDRFGGFVVETYDNYSIVDGSVADGVVPISVLEEVGREGDCKLMRRNNPFCDPPCGPDETCDFEQNCILYPLNQDIGTVTVTGLSGDVVMEPLQPGNSYFNTTLPHPAFEPESLVTLTTTGGAYDPVRLHAVGVETLTILDETWVVDSGTDLTVNWTPPTVDIVRSEIALRFNIDQHGSTPVSVFCSFEDDGQAVLPASIIDQLMGFGVSGFPNGELSRRTMDQVRVGDGCMEFELGSPKAANVRVEGYIPCDDPTDCPGNMTCNLEIGLCE